MLRDAEGTAVIFAPDRQVLKASRIRPEHTMLRRHAWHVARLPLLRLRSGGAAELLARLCVGGAPGIEVASVRRGVQKRPGTTPLRVRGASKHVFLADGTLVPVFSCPTGIGGGQEQCVYVDGGLRLDGRRRAKRYYCRCLAHPFPGDRGQYTEVYLKAA